jgi:hypothetical protein
VGRPILDRFGATPSFYVIADETNAASSRAAAIQNKASPITLFIDLLS